MKTIHPGHRQQPFTDLHLGFVAAWACALQGSGDLGSTLHSLVKLLDADAAMLVRSQTRRNSRVAIAKHDTADGRYPMVEEDVFLVDSILEKMLMVARPGTVWALSEARREGAQASRMPSLRALGPASVRDGVVVILESDGLQIDHLEVRFRRQPRPERLDMLEHIAGTLANCWSGRKIGLIRSHLDRADIRPSLNDGDKYYSDILSYDNPSDLTRCEFRVCMYLKNGLRAKYIASKLGVSEATVRSHLSTIYSKLGISGQIELLHVLNGGFGQLPHSATGGRK